MGKVAIVTDSNSGITQAEGKKMGIYVLPMPFYINEELFTRISHSRRRSFMKNWQEMQILRLPNRLPEM